MSDTLYDFLTPLQIRTISNDAGYKEGQIGTTIKLYEESLPDLEEADIILVGCSEQRGAALLHESTASNFIRHELYNLYNWHTDIRLVDIGNIKRGKSANDTLAALKVVLKEVHAAGKIIVIIGGSNDLMLAQYHAFAEEKILIDAVGIDATIDINIDSPFRADNFLMEMLTMEPNYMRHYNHIGFQSYFTHPRMLETMDKLRFDCYRVGKVKESIEEMEPVIRNCHLLSFDISAIANAYAPANEFSPNGFNGEEACTLAQYAGMSNHMQSIGIYGYRPELDKENMTAKQISQMIWYLIDGKNKGRREADIKEKSEYNEYHISFAELETTFVQSKKTGRWWMKLSENQFIACSYQDYITAANNEIPERWMRVQERP